jgi:uncharacterized damage-inducible protein DinB
VTTGELRLLLDYHYWARDRLLDAIAPLASEAFTRDMGSSFRSIRDTIVHVYLAEWAWYSRWQGHSPTEFPALDSFPDVAAVRAAWSELETRVGGFLESLGEDDVTRVFDYRLFSGQPGRSAFWQMLQHVVNHASYHRGQVTTMLRQLGAAPAKSMDLITFYRERGA